MGRLRVGIIGCGAIGTTIALACRYALKKKVSLTAFYDTDKPKMKAFAKRVGLGRGASSAKALADRCGLIIEAAGAKAAVEALETAVRAKKDVMIMSVGGILSSPGSLRKAERAGIRVYVPSGAVAGLDAMKAAAVSGIKSVTLTTRKPPAGLSGAAYIEKKGIRLEGLKREKVIFDGSAREAVRAFPKNVNVSAVLSLAGIGGARTRVRVTAVPGAKSNSHEVEIKGVFGTVKTVTENVPFRDNPKTSYLAALSAIATLKGIVVKVKIGT